MLIECFGNKAIEMEVQYMVKLCKISSREVYKRLQSFKVLKVLVLVLKITIEDEEISN